MVQPLDCSNLASYSSLLAEAIRVLTAAARICRPTSDADGEERREPIDWAEFVTRALAGAAANVGHVGAVFAGRSGSWEAEAVRRLVYSTVGDEDQLLRHRTEPVEVKMGVDEILLDAGVWTAYDDAADELARRDEALWAAASEPLTVEQEREGEAIADLSERLETQRPADWAAYGEALRACVEAGAAKLENLRVPVVVHVDVDTFRSDVERARCFDFITLSDELVEEAVWVTPLPGGGLDPLQRISIADQQR